MKQLQEFWYLIAMITGLYLIILLVGCGSPPLIQPASDVSAAQTTTATSQSVSTATVESETAASPESAAPESPLATPTSVLAAETPTTVLETLASSSNETEYSAEKISLKPMNLTLNLSGVSAQNDASEIGLSSWSNNGRKFTFRIPSSEILVDSNAPAGYDNTYTASELWVANVDGTTPQKIADQTGNFGLWSPADTHLAYNKRVGVFSQEIWVADLTTNMSVKMATPPDLEINKTDYYGSIEWLDNHHLLYATYSNTGERHAWLHNVETNLVEAVLVDERLDNRWSSFWLAPNKVSIIGDTVNNLWLGEIIEDKGQFKVNYVKTIFSETGLIPEWAPDSSKIAIRSYGQDTLRILQLASDKIVEIPFASNVAQVEWSPDSQMLMVSNEASGQPMVKIQVVNTDGSHLELLSLSTSNYFQWSPNGRYVVITPTQDHPSGNLLNIFKVEISQ